MKDCCQATHTHTHTHIYIYIYIELAVSDEVLRYETAIIFMCLSNPAFVAILGASCVAMFGKLGS